MADFNEIPIKALRLGTIAFLSSALSHKKVIPSPSNLPRDWRGLAHLFGLSSHEYTAVSASSDKVTDLLKYWKNGTVGKLNLYLEELDRFDVLDDYRPMLEKDVKHYLDTTCAVALPPSLEVQAINDSASDSLTLHDAHNVLRGEGHQKYAAYILFAEEDTEFAMLVIETLQDKYNMLVCHRDLLLAGTSFTHDAEMRLIADRCRMLVVVVSPSFLQCPANKYLYTFAQSIAIDQRVRKVIPILYQKCELPAELKFYHLLDYTKPDDNLWRFWDKLYSSLQASSSTSSWQMLEPSRDAVTNPRNGLLAIEPAKAAEQPTKVQRDSREENLNDLGRLGEGKKSDESVKKKLGDIKSWLSSKVSLKEKKAEGASGKSKKLFGKKKKAEPVVA